MKNVGEYVKISIILGLPILLVWYLVRYGYSHIYDAVIGQHGIRFLLFKRFLVLELKFESIERVYDRKTFLSSHNILVSMFRVFPVVNRISKYPSPIIVQRKSGFIKYLSLTPENPESFLAQLNDILRDRGRHETYLG